MIDYLDIAGGAIRLYKDEKVVALSNSPQALLRDIRQHGGLPRLFTATSEFIQALCGVDEVAEEAGFESADEFRQIWNQVEHILWKNEELV